VGSYAAERGEFIAHGDEIAATLDRANRMFPGIGNRVSAPCGHQTQPQRMIVLQPPLVRHFFEQHQMRHRERSCASSTIKNSVPYWCKCPMMVPLAGAPMPSDRET